MLIELANTPRDYAWGSRTAMADFLGVPPSGRPEAELWLGTHAGSPARSGAVVPPERHAHATLTQWLRARPALLGARHAPAADLPILLKVLAAERPLSLQVHPTSEQARAGFADEQARGIPLDDPRRNYKDPHPKPEILVAVSDGFDALCGFRPAAEVAELVQALRSAGAGTGPAGELLARLDGSLAVAVQWLLSDASQAAVDEVIACAATPQAARSSMAETFATVVELAAHAPADPGVVIAALMNRVRLRRGEGLFAPAGLLHAYLHGVGIELMTTSDNVVRGGMTPKHVDTAELMRLLSFEQGAAQVLAPRAQAPGLTAYDPPAPFLLMLAEPGAQTVEVVLDGPAIVLAERGPVTVAAGADRMVLGQGGAAFVSGDVSAITVSEAGRLWVAVAR